MGTTLLFKFFNAMLHQELQDKIRATEYAIPEVSSCPLFPCQMKARVMCSTAAAQLGLCLTKGIALTLWMNV